MDSKEETYQNNCTAATVYLPFGLLLWSILALLIASYYLILHPKETYKMIESIMAVGVISIVTFYWLGKYDLNHNGPYKIRISDWEVHGYFRRATQEKVIELDRGIPFEDISNIHVWPILGTGVDAHPDGLWVVTERTKHFRLTISNARRVEKAWQTWKAMQHEELSTSSNDTPT